MKYLYLLVAIVNAIYGMLMLLTLSPGTPGYMIVFTIGMILTILGVTGFFFWIRTVIKLVKDQPIEDELLNSWWQLAKSFDTVLIIGLLIRILVIQPFVVEGNSMEPNFHNRQALLVDKLSYRFREPLREEVIIFKAPPQPTDDYIKRIIGVPGDTIIIKNSQVIVNNQPLRETYLDKNNQTLINKDIAAAIQTTLQKDEFFVLGDNRSNSSDSREWGVVPRSYIIGRPVVSVFPAKNFGLVKTPSAF